MKETNNSAWCLDQIQLLLESWKHTIAQSRSVPHFEDQGTEDIKCHVLEDCIAEIEKILYD